MSPHDPVGHGIQGINDHCLSPQ